MHSEDLTHSINNLKGKITNNNLFIPDVCFHPSPVYRPPPKPIMHDMTTKELKGTHLLVDIKEIHTRYLHSSCFKDMFLYLSQNKLPSSKAAIKKVEALSE